MPDWLIPLIGGGLGGAVLTQLVNRWERVRRIKVELNLDIIAVEAAGPVEHIQIGVSNHGRQDVIFKTANGSIGIAGLTTHLFIAKPIPSVSFPYTLKHGDSFYLMTEKKPLLEMLADIQPLKRPSIRAVMSDALNRPYYSEWQFIELSEPSV